MFMEERQTEIIETIKNKGKILISEIAEKYGISDESARRDLRMLEQKGLCKRTYGGAIKLQQVGVRLPADRDFDKMPVYDNYREIAKEAVTHIKENDIIYLTGGSFGHIILSFLPKDFHYTLVVNSVDIAKKLRAFDNIDVYSVGGKMRQSGSITDSLATEFISRFHFDTCFITGAGLTADFGLSNGTDETAAFQRAVMRNSRNKILLIPSNKVGSDSFIKVCKANCFDIIITDWDCVKEEIELLRDMNIEVVTVLEQNN